MMSVMVWLPQDTVVPVAPTVTVMSAKSRPRAPLNAIWSPSEALKSSTRSIPVVFVSTKAPRADQVWARMQGGREVGRTFGWHRAEVFAALVNGSLLLLIALPAF